MAPTRFGTDGVRGVANEELTPELALALRRATARVLPAPTFVVCGDTRRSGPLPASGLLGRAGRRGCRRRRPRRAAADAGRGSGGRVPQGTGRRDLGLAQPFADNGIKLFSLFLGTKLPDDVEAEIEAPRSMPCWPTQRDHPPRRPTGHGVGRISADPTGAAELYEDHLRGDTPRASRLDGLSASSSTAPTAPPASCRRRCWPAASADVTVLHSRARPTGRTSTTTAGSTDPGELARAVVAQGAHLGLAFDGDADRVIAVDHLGNVVDGDALLALFALDLAERGRLAGNTVAVTVMTNLGFRLAMEARGASTVRRTWGTATCWPPSMPAASAWAASSPGTSFFRARSTTGDVASSPAWRWPTWCSGPGALLGRGFDRPGGAGPPSASST